MLNDASKQGISEILSSLEDNAVIALATTITQGLLKNKINSRQEALNAVLNYSSDALSFLRRKIITRELLLSYLHHKNVPVDLPVTKNDLIEKTAHFWNIQYKVQDCQIPPNPADTGSVSLLAEQFTQWFYTLMNKNECISPEHFYPDARLQITMSNNGQLMTEIVENDPKNIVEKLFSMRTTYNLFFNPNLSNDGVQGRIEPHGLVLVMVCGTLHVEGACVGVFEQIFALARDPLADNNWKIKISEINLKSQDGAQGLNGCNVMALT